MDFFIMTIDEWFDIACEEFPQINREYLKMLPVQYRELEDKGAVFYVIMVGTTSKIELIELFFYLKPEYRNLNNCNKLLEIFENVGREEKCDIIKFGSNLGYRDDVFSKFLLRKGYKIDTVSKEI